MPAPRKVKIGNEVFESLREAAEFYGTHRHLIAKALKDSDPEKYIQQNFEDHLYMGFDTAKVTNAGKPIKELRLRKAIIRKRVRSYLRYQQTFERQKQQHNAPNAKIRTSKAEYVYDGSGIVVHCGNQDHPERWVSAAQRLQWCGHCRKSVRTLKDGVNAVFEAAGLTILPGQTYKNASTKMKCHCTEGHIALRSRMDVEHRGRRCPTCTGYRGQEVVRDILNKAFKISLEGPDRSLLDGYELDGVDRDARISFEYQGEHHFNKVGYCRTPLRIIRKTDEYKRKEMLRKGYTHIEITELRATKAGFKHDECVEEVYAQLASRYPEMVPVLKVSEISESTGTELFGYRSEIQKIESTLNITLLSARVPCRSTSLDWICDVHAAKMRGSLKELSFEISHGTFRGCYHCGRKKMTDQIWVPKWQAQRQLANQVAATKGYHITSEPAEWRVKRTQRIECERGHVAELLGSQILQGHPCPRCDPLYKRGRMPTQTILRLSSEIRRLRKNGATHKFIAEQFNIAASTVRNVLNGRGPYAVDEKEPTE